VTAPTDGRKTPVVVGKTRYDGQATATIVDPRYGIDLIWLTYYWATSIGQTLPVAQLASWPDRQYYGSDDGNDGDPVLLNGW
jgi:hypothetical protein